jgi:hypothetical protein
MIRLLLPVGIQASPLILCRPGARSLLTRSRALHFCQQLVHGVVKTGGPDRANSDDPLGIEDEEPRIAPDVVALGNRPRAGGAVEPIRSGHPLPRHHPAGRVLIIVFAIDSQQGEGLALESLDEVAFVWDLRHAGAAP